MTLRSPFAAIAALLLAACSPADPAPTATAAPAEGRPALWKLADADTTIWLFGTIHVLPDGYKWQNKTISDTIAAADGLVIETVLDSDPAKASALLMRMGATSGLPPLVERVAPAKRPALETMIARSGLPRATFDAMETWTAALLLVGVSLIDLELSPASGIEEQLETQFSAAGKPISGLETAEQQLGYFDRLPETAQRQFLTTLVDDPAAARIEYEAMLAAWARGDEQAIADAFDEDFEVSAALRDALLRKRNAAWAEWLAKRLDAPGKVLVAVGAGHLAGPESVQTMLAKKGFTVERVQ